MGGRCPVPRVYARARLRCNVPVRQRNARGPKSLWRMRFRPPTSAVACRERLRPRRRRQSGCRHRRAGNRRTSLPRRWPQTFRACRRWQSPPWSSQSARPPSGTPACACGSGRRGGAPARCLLSRRGACRWDEWPRAPLALPWCACGRCGAYGIPCPCSPR